MSARRGFTLLEVMVALVVSAMVVTLAYGAAQAGFDTEARLREGQAAARATTAWRALLGDALRHVERGVADDDAVFE
ncbi:MAG: PulJ/GspJ family protein, partial [Gemmatirosa sp.]